MLALPMFHFRQNLNYDIPTDANAETITPETINAVTQLVKITNYYRQIATSATSFEAHGNCIIPRHSSSAIYLLFALGLD